MITKTIELYTFDELTDTAKERARDWWRGRENREFGSFGKLSEPAGTAAKLLGIEFGTHLVTLTRMSGPSFSGTYSYVEGSVEAIQAEFPADLELHRIARELAELQKKHQYKLTASISAGFYGARSMQVECDEPYDVENALLKLMREFAQWIFVGLRAAYEYHMSNENVDYTIRVNEYMFLATGKFYLL